MIEMSEDKENKKLTPLEAFFETEPTSPITIMEDDEKGYMVEQVQSELFDDKDNEIEQHFQRLYEIAMVGYEAIMTELDGAPPEQVHKLATAAQKYLTSATDAVKQKANLKSHKDKMEQAERSGQREIQGNAVKVLADRNDILREMMDNQSKDEKNNKT